MPKQNVLTVNEIFESLQGESTNTGLPTVFVRLFGCNCWCKYCDTPQDKNDKRRMTIADVVKAVEGFRMPRVCFTGGEPLLQWDDLSAAVLELVTKNYDVSIETNGCVEIEDANVRSYRYIMDIKCPSSKMSGKNIYENFHKLKPFDEVKFVIKDKADYSYMRKVMTSYHMPNNILVSPCMQKNDDGTLDLSPAKQIAEWIMRDKLFNVRLNIQIHKIIEVK